MTYSQRWKKRLGKAAFERLSPALKRHIKRMDALPKPVKTISARRMHEILGT
jgi:hypothetical protein